MFARIAYMNRNRPGITWPADQDDMADLVAMTAKQMVTEVATPAATHACRWERGLFVQANHDIRQWVELAENTTGTGRPGHVRRADLDTTHLQDALKPSGPE